MQSHIAIDALLEGLARAAEIVYLPMPDDVVQIEVVGGRATLYLDPECIETASGRAQLCAALADVLVVLAVGPEASNLIVLMRRLRSVG